MSVVIQVNEQFEIPLARSLAEFREWALAEESESKVRVDYLAGRIEVEMSPEDIYAHGRPKTHLVVVLGTIVENEDLGDLLTDSTRVSCPEADLSVEPDIVFVSHESLAADRVRLVPRSSREPNSYIELEGPPDLIVEIVSKSSVRKDTVRLLDAYYRAGVREYWLVDARREEILFVIHRPGPTRYEAAPIDAEGFQRSDVLNRWFRFTRERRADGLWSYRAEHRRE